MRLDRNGVADQDAYRGPRPRPNTDSTSTARAPQPTATSPNTRVRNTDQYDNCDTTAEATATRHPQLRPPTGIGLPHDDRDPNTDSDIERPQPRHLSNSYGDQHHKTQRTHKRPRPGTPTST